MRNAVNVRAKVDFGYVLVGVMKMGFTTHKRFKKGGEMKASELRLGNYYLYCIHDELDNPRDYEIVDQIDAQDLVWLSSEAGENDDQYKPIPLTEDWLKRFGFKKNKNDDYEIEIGRKGFIMAEAQDDGYCFLLYRNDVGMDYIGLEFYDYAHDLQNIIYALTGEELKLREE